MAGRLVFRLVGRVLHARLVAETDPEGFLDFRQVDPVVDGNAVRPGRDVAGQGAGAAAGIARWGERDGQHGDQP